MFRSCVERRDAHETRQSLHVAFGRTPPLRGGDPVPNLRIAVDVTCPPRPGNANGGRIAREHDSPLPHYLTRLPLSSRSGTLYSRKMPVMAAWLSASSFSTTFFHSRS